MHSRLGHVHFLSLKIMTSATTQLFEYPIISLSPYKSLSSLMHLCPPVSVFLCFSEDRRVRKLPACWDPRVTSIIPSPPSHMPLLTSKKPRPWSNRRWSNDHLTATLSRRHPVTTNASASRTWFHFHNGDYLGSL